MVGTTSLIKIIACMKLLEQNSGMYSLEALFCSKILASSKNAWHFGFNQM